MKYGSGAGLKRSDCFTQIKKQKAAITTKLGRRMASTMVTTGTVLTKQDQQIKLHQNVGQINKSLQEKYLVHIIILCHQAMGGTTAYFGSLSQGTL